MTLTDEQLMQHYCAGDPQAFDRLYGRHRAALYRYVQRLCNHCVEAEELYQDVWLRVVRARQQWQADQTFRPWLYRIAHNRVMDHWRQHGRLPEPEDEAPEIADKQPEPDTMKHLSDCVQRLMALLAQLPEVQRSAFLLKEDAGLSLQQIADVSACERETVKSRLRYAMQRLRRGLEGCDD